MKKIVFTGGGTAGHITPNLAIINELKNFKVYYIGSNGMEKEIIQKYPNITFIEIPVVKFNRSNIFKNFNIPFKLISSIKKCKKILKEISPDIIFSKGGYVSIPPCFAGYQLKIPVITHESDLSIGLANKLIARKSKYLCCSFKSTAEKYGRNAIHTGSPIRREIFIGKKEIIINKYRIRNNLPIILIVGGSQGAKAINTAIWNNIDKLINKYNILHIVGKDNINHNLDNKTNYYQVEFASDIENYFKSADLIISRAGSNTIFEILSLNKPMILIPLPKTSHSRGDQVDNAKYFKDNNYAEVIEQDNLSETTLLDTIDKTLKNKLNYIKTMSNDTKINANEKIINLINEITK